MIFGWQREKILKKLEILFKPQELAYLKLKRYLGVGTLKIVEVLVKGLKEITFLQKISVGLHPHLRDYE
jgi:hypothetical protein